MQKSDNRELLTSTLILTGVNLFSQVLGFFYRVWLSRLISAEAIGLYGLVMPVYSIIMSLCVSGLTVAVSRLSAQFSATGKENAMRQAVRVARHSYIILVLSVSVPLCAFSDFVSAEFLGDARTRLALLILIPEILLTGWENVHKNYFYGRKNIIPPAVAEVLEQLTRTGAILLLLWYFRPQYEELQVGTIIVGMLISEIFSAGLLTYFYRRDIKKNHTVSADNEDKKFIRQQVFKIAVPVGASVLLTNIIGSLNSIIIPDRLIVSGIDPNIALSSFGVTFGMTMPLLGLPLAFTVSIGLCTLPRITESAALGDIAAVKRKIRDVLLISSGILVVCMSVLMPFGEGFAKKLFANPQAGQFMVPLAIATIFGCYEQILGSMLNALGGQKQMAANYISTGIVQLILTYFLVATPEFRLFGFVLAYIICNIIGAGMCCFDLAKLLRRKNFVLD